MCVGGNEPRKGGRRGEALEEDGNRVEAGRRGLKRLSPDRGRGSSKSKEWQRGVSFTTGDAESPGVRKPAFWS